MNKQLKPYLQRVYTPGMIRERLQRSSPRQRAQRSIISSVLMLMFLVLIGILFRDVVYGRIFIFIYGLVAIIVAIPAVQTYKMAAISLVCVPALSLLHSTTLSSNFAQYAFLLICIGVICSFMEAIKSTILQRREAKLGIKTIAPPEELP